MEELMSRENLEHLHEVLLEILDEITRICDKHNIKYFLTGGTLLGAIRHEGYIPWDDDLDIGMLRNDYEKFLQICKNELSDKYIVDNKNTNPKYYLNFTKIRKKNTIMEQNFQNNYTGPKGIWVDIFPFDDAVSGNPKDIKHQAIITKTIFRVLHYKNGFFLGHKSWLKKIIGILFKIIPNKWLLDYQEKVMKRKNNKNYEYMVALSSSQEGIKGYNKELLPKSVYFPLKKGQFEGKIYSIPNNPHIILTRLYGDYMKLLPEEKRVTHNPVRLEF